MSHYVVYVAFATSFFIFDHQQLVFAKQGRTVALFAIVVALILKFISPNDFHFLTLNDLSLW